MNDVRKSKKKILIIKNIEREGPGLFLEVLKEHNISYTIADLSIEPKFPNLKNYNALVVLGGPDSANDNNLKMENELAGIRSALDINIPYLGICLGLQTLVKAVGGTVVTIPVKEIGFKDMDKNNFEVELTGNGKIDSLFEGLSNSFNIFHLHGETVELTNNMTLLAEGKYCKNQVVKVGSNAYGIQCHFELTQEMFEKWINEDPDLLKLDKTELRKDFESIKSEYTKTGKQLFVNFLKIARLIT